MPSSIGLTTLSRRIVAGGRALRRDESVRVIAAVTADVIASGDSDAVFRNLSHGQIGADQLVVSRRRAPSLIAHTAEFVDLLHSSMHHAFAVPPAAWLDLRFKLDFYDDPDDPDSPWTYVLLGTESMVLRQRWQEVDGVEPYPLPDPDQPTDEAVDDVAERAAVWTRVLAPFTHSAPVTWLAPDPELLFDVVDSLRDPTGDEHRAADGLVTVSLIADALVQHHGIAADDVLEIMTTQPNATPTH